MADTLLDKRFDEFLQASPNASREEIAEFRKLVEGYFLGEITPDQFKARRLHMGTYGIRATKDVHMMRIKVPQGNLTADQLEALADVAEAYSKSIGHITTRQDVQLYWIPTRDSPKVMARLSAVGLTTREACGNSVRNVTACHFAGVSPTELFDITKHSEAVTAHFLRNPASQQLPRKFKIAFEGCSEDHAKTVIHDIGAVAAIQEQGGKQVIGFKLYVGGGLGAAPMQAILLEPFTPATELLRTCEAAVRVHDRLGDRKNKATARIKFVVKRLGADAFRKEVFAERDKLPAYAYPDMHVTETDERPPVATDVPAAPTVNPTPGGGVNGTYQRWIFTNVMGQRQAGYSVVTIRLRLGDISSSQMRSLAKIVRRYCGGKLRTTIDQNLVLCWVRSEHLTSLFSELEPVGLAETEAGKLHDVTSCPGAETCQLGISASRGLARAIEAKFKDAKMGGPDVDDVRVKISGCPNSCGQHHIADIGFFGGARKVNDRLAPHFQLMLGGLCEEGKVEFAKPVLKLPAKRIPDAVLRMLELYRKDRTSPDERFRAFSARVGTGYWQQALDSFTTLPPHEQSPEAYRDWGAETEFSLGDMGPGECAA
ncbi:MAG: nitrite/sulfite reductase [Candidatus Omnitrophica bacterium]|nr:nitrite/sulfite reductase [Candidatus Omnitrophota bacterium]